MQNWKLYQMESVADPGLANQNNLRSGGKVHVIGAGPVGLLLTALLQSMEFPVRLYEKRPKYTRTRMVKLSSFLVADSVESYCEDHIDGETIKAVFDVAEIEEGLAFRQSIRKDLMSLIRGWAQGFCPLNAIEEALSSLIDNRGMNGVERIATNLTAGQAIAMLGPRDILIDCTGCKSLLRDHLVPGPNTGEKDANTFNIQLEYAIVVTFVYNQEYQCNEYCKYYKNVENRHYKFIPAVDRTCYDGNTSFVSGIVNITPEDYNLMPATFDGQWLRVHFPQVARSMDRFIDKIKQETHGEIISNVEVVRIPLNLYRALNVTSRKWLEHQDNDHPFTSSPVFLVGDSALGSPYFQSISLGLESAIHLAGLIEQRNLPLADIFNRFELYMYKQWLRVYMRSKMIKHNKDLFENIDDPFRLLELLHIY
jgi:2-polyprenyl-6-methoxyphenol hydroxylase-like FAD-dependent oxidoreductase